jgi:hypothetical protein
MGYHAILLLMKLSEGAISLVVKKNAESIFPIDSVIEFPKIE